MASLLKDSNRTTKKPNGCRTVQFVIGKGKGSRKSIRLGKISQRNAEAIKVKVEALIEASVAQTSWDNETATWVRKLDPKLHDKLTQVGLVDQRPEAEQVALGAFIDGYIKGKSDVKPGTKEVYQHARQLLVDYFGEEKLIAKISAGDVDDWRLHLLEKGLAKNTVCRRCGIARQFFKYAVRKRLIAENPFAEITGGVAVRRNPDKDYFVSREEAAKVLDACPDAQWRLLFALSRFGGLRCPSEHLALRWGDVNWEQSRLTIRSPKTERYEGKAERVMPIFPELRPYLEEVYDQAPEGSECVITRYHRRSANLRHTLIRIIEKAGLKRWPLIFQNLRKTRETELTEVFPLHVVCSWLGNSPKVAMKHYLQTTDDHFAQAIAEETGARLKAQQQPSVSGCNDVEGVYDFVEKPAEPLKSSDFRSSRWDSSVSGSVSRPRSRRICRTSSRIF